MPAIDCNGNGALFLGNGFESELGDNLMTDNWFVDYIYYRLVKVIVYHDDSVTSGFKVFYEPQPAAEFTGWP